MILTHHGIDSLRSKNVVVFGDIAYGFVKIGGLLWTTENLKNYHPNASYYENSSYYKDLGYLYKTETIISNTNTQSSFINGLLHDGWRVPTKSDFETLLSYSVSDLKDKLNSWLTNGTNASGFNCYASGIRYYDGAWYPRKTAFISQTLVRGGVAYYFVLDNSSVHVNSNEGALTNEGYRMRSVRLCRDA